ncbi:RHS repeat-associated core domain-containing protein [Pseudomonas monsensis]
MTYDKQLRVVAVEENRLPDVDTFTYADASADARLNLRGQLIEQADTSGGLKFDGYGLSGLPLSETRTFHDGPAFTTHQVYGPTGMSLEQTDAGGHRRQSRYDLAGQLKHMQLLLRDNTVWHPVLLAAQYNAAGQMIEQLAGNGVVSQWHYDPVDGRLRRQAARKPSQPPLQDFEYFYDLAGNITRIDDHTFKPAYFANQRVDGSRQFSYDSLYRLASASGYDDGPLSDTPGLPQPTDPKNRLNYTQTYHYDHSNNLIKLVHERDGACQTREMTIDPDSNRGLRRDPEGPDPDFDALFDHHGNLQALQPGQDLHWNARDELQSVTLIRRDDGRHDAEHYRYSQGVRVFKRHEMYTPGTVHFHQVRYLPGLEIRSKDNGEELHVINIGNVRCLHWTLKKPDGIDDDQLRYSLDDHLGSCVMELDQQANMISHEGYYPFGATAWMATHSAIEVSYKFIRYSGREMDVSGLYYYGARYYAPWLQRWISADPAGDVDGLNFYAFVGNNPVGFIDEDGQRRRGLFNETRKELAARKAQSAAKQQRRAANRALSDAVDRHMKILEITELRARAIEAQLNNLQSSSALVTSAVKRTGTFAAKQAISTGVGIGVSAVAGVLGTAAGPVGTAFGIALGIFAKIGTGLALDYLAEQQGLSTAVPLKSRKLDPLRIVAKGEYKTAALASYAEQKLVKTFEAATNPSELTLLKGFKGVSSHVVSAAMKAHGTPQATEIGAILSTLMGAAEIMYEIETARHGMTPAMQEKLERLNQYIPDLIDVLERGQAEVNTRFDAARRDSIHTYRMFKKLFGSAPGDSRQSVAMATQATIGSLRRLHSMIN